MGLLDVIQGMLNGPHGQRETRPAGGGGGMSPIMMALLGLLAYKALRGSGSQTTPTSLPGRPDNASSPSGGLGEAFGGLFGGNAGGVPNSPPIGSRGAQSWPGGLSSFLGGAAAGGVLSSGLSNLIKSFQQSGYGGPAQSWVGTGPNQEIAPQDLERALGRDTIDALAQQTGMSRQELLEALSERLPEFVDQLTPDGRLPPVEH